MTERQKRILIVDDEEDIRRFLKASLKLYQYEILEAGTGNAAIEAVDDQRPDLVILDLGLPDLDGVEVTRQVRQTSHIPIIILSVRNSEGEKIEALDAGADDYLTKPFGMGELLARVRVVLRRSEPQGTTGLLTYRDLSLDRARHKVTLHEKEITLTPTEFDILTVLMQNAGVVVTHHQLVQQVWGPAYEEDSGRLIRVNISNLRRKIESDPNRPSYILTELGVGYRFNDSED